MDEPTNQIPQLVKHLQELIYIIHQNTLPTPDKEHTSWAKAEQARKFLESFRHVTHHKRGGDYTLLGEAQMQAENWRDHDAYSDSNGEFPSVDMSNVIVYLDSHGDLWVRPTRDFKDGRFSDIKPEGR